MKKNYLFVLTFIFSLLAYSGYAQSFDNGVFILNEGMFGTNTASVSFLNDSGTLENDIFVTQNPGQDIGQLGQGMGFDGDNAYIIGSGSNEINVVDRVTFTHIVTVTTDINNPRYIAFDNGFGYITNWGDPAVTTDDYVAIMDLSTNTVVNTIPVIEGPEKIIKKNNQLFVAHKGGYNVNNVISVINTLDSSLETITVNDAPDELFIDNQGHLTVLSSGVNQYWLTPPVETLASITRIDLNDNSIISNIEFPEGQHPGLMTCNDGNTYYILNNGLYSLSDTETSLPTTTLFDITATSAYGMAVNNNLLYVTDAGNFSGNSTLKVYDLSSGSETNSFDVGVIASKVYFN